MPHDDPQEPIVNTTITYYRNYNSSDSTTQTYDGYELASISTLGFIAPTGYKFKEWNNRSDGVGSSYSVGDSYGYTSVYAIWEEISDRKQWYERPKNITVAKYRLTGNGLCMSSSSYSLYKYYVTAGEILYLYLNDVVVSNVSQNVYQFQSAESVPTSGTNSTLIGSPVVGPVDAYVEVPEGATYLVVSQLTASTNFKVCATLPDGGTISSVTPLDENTYEIKDKIARQTIPFGTTDFSSTSTAYTATVEGITELRSGVACFIMNTKVTSATGFTVNINSLGAKPVYMPTAAATRATSQFTVNYTWLLVYNENRVAGGCWDLCYMYNTDNNTIGYNIRNYSGSLTAKAAIYRYMVLLTVDENTVVPINSTSNSTATTKTLTTESFDPFGPIYYYSTTTTISAGSTIGASYRWTQYAIDLRYSFNTGSTLTSNKAVYMVADPQSDGKAKLASSPITQTLPSTEDGKIYIRLGVAYSEYQLQLENNHPIYYYKNGAIRLWTNTPVGVPAPSSPSPGQVLMYNNGSWQAMYQDKSLQLPYQIIPLSFDGSDFSTTITPQDIAEGYTVNNDDYPPYNRSSFTKADLLGQMSILLTPIIGNTDGYEFQSSIFALDSFGWTGEIGLLRIETNGGYQNPYSITLVKWPAGLPNPTDFVEDASACIYALSSSVNQGGQTILHLDEEFTEISAMVQTGRKVLFVWPDFGNSTFFALVYSSQYDETITLYSCGVYSNGIVTLSSDQNGGMTGTLQLVSTGEGKLDTPASANVGDVLSYTSNGWSSVGISTLTGNLVTSISSSSTDSQYPSAKCMYNIIGDVETLLAAI